MAANIRLILGSVLGCAVAYSGYSYYERQSHYDDLLKNAKLPPVADGIKKGMAVMPEKKGKLVKNASGRFEFIEDKSAGAVSPSVSTAKSGLTPPVPTPQAPAVPVAFQSPAAAAPSAASTINPAPGSITKTISVQAAASPPMTPVPGVPTTTAPKTALIAQNQVPPASPTNSNAVLIAPPPVQSNVQLIPKSELAAKETEKTPEGEKTCDWKTSMNYINVRYGPFIIRGNLRVGLNSKSALLSQFLGHAKPTTDANEEGSSCASRACLIINSELFKSIEGGKEHDLNCGDWYLVADGSPENCLETASPKDLRITKVIGSSCVVASITEIRSTSAPAKVHPKASSIFVTETKSEQKKSVDEKKRPESD